MVDGVSHAGEVVVEGCSAYALYRSACTWSSRWPQERPCVEWSMATGAPVGGLRRFEIMPGLGRVTIRNHLRLGCKRVSELSAKAGT